MGATLWQPTAVGLLHNGSPAASGKVYGYEPGTSTPKAMYPTKLDADAQTNALANPVIVDAQGRAQIWLNGVYDIEMFTAGDVAIGGTYQSVGEPPAGTPEVPSGAVIGWPFNEPPTGYLECNGSAVSRATYANLFAVIGTMYGIGDGSTTFNLPDYRGEFLRGWAHGQATDPDKATRTDRGDATTGDNVGTKQANAFSTHQHAVPLNRSGGGSVISGGFFNSTTDNPNADTKPGGGTLDAALNIDTAGVVSIPVGSSTSTETRPRNVNVMWCVKT